MAWCVKLIQTYFVFFHLTVSYSYVPSIRVKVWVDLKCPINVTCRSNLLFSCLKFWFPCKKLINSTHCNVYYIKRVVLSMGHWMRVVWDKYETNMRNAQVSFSLWSNLTDDTCHTVYPIPPVSVSAWEFHKTSQPLVRVTPDLCPVSNTKRCVQDQSKQKQVLTLTHSFAGQEPWEDAKKKLYKGPSKSLRTFKALVI